ncbi:MAG: class I SAM-dependent methyltransferase [Cyclobacteriaceae bacterium]|nr:class I SAM-dependent methyltransferase [Cyclobacteriaceae bacterium HetDA_MAG_MS6]
MSKFQVNESYGYFEVIPKPTDSELRDYYQKKYYQDDHATYSKEYDEEELAYFRNKITQKDHVVDGLLNDSHGKSLLDIGCGEGFTMDHYHQKGWSVRGIDFSDFGLKRHHPYLAGNLTAGNIFDTINQLIEEQKKYDLVWLDNVLEHVIDPRQLVLLCHQLTQPKGVLVVEVPNDYSHLQSTLLNSEKVERKYWEAYPDHLSYFSRESLVRLLSSNGWDTQKVLADYPIEWFLANKNTNYVSDRDVGKSVHQARMFIENFLHEDQSSNMEDLVAFYEAMAKIGQGRQLIGFFSRK